MDRDYSPRACPGTIRPSRMTSNRRKSTTNDPGGLGLATLLPGPPASEPQERRVNQPLKEAEKHAVKAAVNHTDELTLIHSALVALKRGDATVRLPYNGSAGFARVAE